MALGLEDLDLAGLPVGSNQAYGGIHVGGFSGRWEVAGTTAFAFEREDAPLRV